MKRVYCSAVENGVTAILATALFLFSFAAMAETSRVSVDSEGVGGLGESFGPALNEAGHLAAFASAADNLVAGDSNAATDVFVHNRNNGQTRRISVDSAGAQVFDDSFRPAISANGLKVGFDSLSGDLVPDDTNNALDVFVHDRSTGEVERVSVSSTGAQANGSSFFARLSANGRYVAYTSLATDLVPDDTNEESDIFVHDRDTGITERVSIANTGEQANSGSFWPAISSNGRWVTFFSSASNLVENDNNDRDDVFVHDRSTGETQRVSLNSNGGEGDGDSYWPDISGDGRIVAFRSDAANLVAGDTNFSGDAFVHDRITGKTQRVSLGPGDAQGNADSYTPRLSANGRLVVFDSSAENLVSNDTNGARDVFVRDRQAQTTVRVSVDDNGMQANAGSEVPAISGNGKVVAFQSFADNLVPDDVNAVQDVFVRVDAGVLEQPPLGEVSATQGWTDVCESRLGEASVLLTGPPTQNGIDPGVARIRPGIRPGCPYQVRFQEWDYLARDFEDFWHKAEQISYLAVTPGVYEMPDGSVWQVGRFNHSGTGNWRWVPFARRFDGPPALFLSVQSVNGGQAVTVRAKAVGRNGFEAAMFEEEYLMDGHAQEQIAYVAIYHPLSNEQGRIDGQARLNGADVPYSLYSVWLDTDWAAIGGVELRLQEEQSKDDETAHAREAVDVLIVDSQVFAQQVSSQGRDTTALRRR